LYPVTTGAGIAGSVAPHPSEDSLGALTMENILSSEFWDSMLIPGAFGLFFCGIWFIDIFLVM
jgi:hypothetical protein